jgi:hypothetical protein
VKKKTAAERNRELEEKAAALGILPLTKERLAEIALGTPEDASDIIEVSTELRRRSRARRRSS